MGSTRKQLLGKAGNMAFNLGQKWFLNRDIEAVERRGQRLGMLLHRLDKKHRTRANANLELAFPDWSAQKREETVLEVFKHFGLVGADFMRSPLRTKEEVLASIEPVGWDEHYAQASAPGKGVMIVTAHFGNWERFAQWLSLKTEANISVVARDADDTGLNRRILGIRESVGVEVLSRGNSARSLIKKLRENRLVGLLPDQNSSECFVPFFGRPCGTVMGPAVLHLRTGAAILPCFCARVGPGKYRAKIYPPMDTSPYDKDPEAITAALNGIIEEAIREHPEQWLWMHDRWKSARRSGLL